MTGSGYRDEYVVGDEAWYAKACRGIDPKPYLTITRAADGGGCHWEFQVVRHDVGCRVEVFDDAWQAFTDRPDIFAALAGLGEGGVDFILIREVLDGLGLTDATDRVGPSARKDAP